MSVYQEPELSYLVLDFRRERETRACLESIKKHTKFAHKVIYLHNGEAEYPRAFFAEGLIDHYIQTKVNHGLGVGTRDLFAASFSPWSLYLQNDQFLNRDFTQEEFDKLKSLVGAQFISPDDGSTWATRSVNVAGDYTGLHRYSERAHLIPTAFYKKMEEELHLSFGGPGPYVLYLWREEHIQNFYKENKFLHYTYETPLVECPDERTVFQNEDGSIWEFGQDTKEVRLLAGPVTKPSRHPPFTEQEWQEVIQTQQWQNGAIPENCKSKKIVWPNESS